MLGSQEFLYVKEIFQFWITSTVFSSGQLWGGGVSIWRLSRLGPCGNRSSTYIWFSSKSCVTEIRICAQRSLNFWTLSSAHLPAMLNIKGQERHIHSVILEQDQSSSTHAGPAAAQLCRLNSQKGGRAATRFPYGSCSGSVRGQPLDKKELGSKRKKKKAY